jgi:dihydrofolate synthase/folylpolyglutamate synthase
LRERFVVAGDVIGDDALIDAAERVAAVSTEITQFDAQIAVALQLFDETPADLVLLETGMGGRDDSTNLIPWPAAAIITPIGLDHQDALGATLADIAAHKAGILKRHSPAIIARQAAEAMAAIEDAARRVGAPLFRCGVEWDVYASNGRLVVQTDARMLDLPLPSLVGAHQLENAGLACAAFLAPTRHTIGDDAFAAGVSTARWSARLQPLTRGRLSAPIRAKGGEVWVDAGHNAHAAEALARALASMKARRGGTNVAIVGLRARKNAEAFARALAPGADHIIAIPLSEDHIAPETLAAFARSAGIAARSASSLAAALREATQFPAPRVLICGSFLLAAEALAGEAPPS